MVGGDGRNPLWQLTENLHFPRPTSELPSFRFFFFFNENKMAKRSLDFELERGLLGPCEGDGDGGISVPAGLRCSVRWGFVGPRTPAGPGMRRASLL